MYERFVYPGLFGAYNAGPGRYAAYAAGHGSLPTETHVYLASVTGNAVPAARLAAKPSTVPVNKIGRASCRERVCTYGSISVVAVALKKKIRTHLQSI